MVAGRGTPATIALQRAGIPFTVHEYAHDPRHESYGLEASQALGVPPERVFKTLIAEVDGNLVTGVVPVRGQLGLKALAAAVRGKKAFSQRQRYDASRDCARPWLYGIATNLGVTRGQALLKRLPGDRWRLSPGE